MNAINTFKAWPTWKKALAIALLLLLLIFIGGFIHVPWVPGGSVSPPVRG